MARPNWGNAASRLGDLMSQYAMMQWQENSRQKAVEADQQFRLKMAADADAAALARDAANRESDNAEWLRRLNETDPLMGDAGIPMAMPMPGMPGSAASEAMGGGSVRLSRAMDLAAANRQQELLDLQRSQEERLASGGWTASSLDGQPMTGVQVWDRQNPGWNQTGGRPLSGSRGTPAFDKTVSGAADQYIGRMDDRAQLDKETGAAMPYAVAERGDLFNQNAYPLPILSDVRSAFTDSVATGRHDPTADTARLAINDVRSTVDAAEAQRMDSALGSELANWEWDQARGEYRKKPPTPEWQYDEKKGRYEKEDWGPNSKMDAEFRPSSKFFRDVISGQLSDGTNEVEWKTIQKWLEKNSLTLRDVLNDQEIAKYEAQAASDGLADAERAELNGGL